MDKTTIKRFEDQDVHMHKQMAMIKEEVIAEIKQLDNDMCYRFQEQLLQNEEFDQRILNAYGKIAKRNSDMDTTLAKYRADIKAIQDF